MTTPIRSCAALSGRPTGNGVFWRLPLADRELLANQARAGSKDHMARAIPDIMDVNEDAVSTAYRATRVRRIIHGHTHRPGIHDDGDRGGAGSEDGARCVV